MRDDYLSRDWAERHGAFSAFVGDLIDQTRIAFEWSSARTFDAPWRKEVPCSPCAERAS